MQVQKDKACHTCIAVSDSGVHVLQHMVARADPAPENQILSLSCVDVVAGVTFGPHFSGENKKTTTDRHDQEPVGCRFLSFARKVAGLIIDSDKIMALMTKALCSFQRLDKITKTFHWRFQ